MRARELSLSQLSWSAHQLVMRFRFDELEFSTVYWYPDTDLLELEGRFGHDLVERLFVHVALFEINKIASLRPRTLSLGPYARHHSEALERLWSTIFHKVWAQWRYENDLPEEPPVRWIDTPRSPGGAPVRRDRQREELLMFCGGGKDSLVNMKLLEGAGIPFATLAYAASIYGQAAPQLALIDGLVARGAATRRHRQIILDDFFDAPVLELYGQELGVRTITAAETPSSIFAALPLMLAHGYGYAVLGHEASANQGNLIWAATGEDVNHQWGKSAEAEALLDDYVRAELVADIGLFSALMPIHDVVIFELLRRDEDSLFATHSCNVAKPWCRRCPKCAYVWLGYRAHLSREVVEAIFPEALLEVPDNYAFFHDMVGLGEHTPFECIGQIEESRIALALCGARGLLGPRGRELLGRLPAMDLDGVLAEFCKVDAASARLPSAYAPGILDQMHSASLSAQARIRGLLGS
ncbi:hypothetical protein G6O69_12400 [Pseudenhygromyxa sp. WMMC2535]|uniref:hypothetical protein n=1 Tax=Pseudenhygromyxa sp. WMMC2535 TaxID=2712867 RepID=UPI001552A0ED|nr:hypothetical protein [Pseudenhygromyxa sp. WMMC2535]NVB38633.1 hypothetical protein [Pseudenhygromyxa sp. WMMC2535]